MPRSSIPVLTDIVEVGANAPAPAPDPVQPDYDGNEDPTVLPVPGEQNQEEFSLNEMTDSDRTPVREDFSLGEITDDDITPVRKDFSLSGMATVKDPRIRPDDDTAAATHGPGATSDKDMEAMIQIAMASLMPKLEKAARKTVENLLKKQQASRRKS